MHARALEIAWHDSTSIWSVDISRTNRVLTAGGDKVARVWRLCNTPHETLRRVHDATTKAVILNSQASLVDWLCDLRAHTTTVNVARFSRDGFTIATGADGGEIVIWTLEDGLPVKSISDGDAPVPKERWVRLATLRGHVQDVLDLAWSSDGSRLVSASIDNAVKVWDIRNPSKTPATLRSHANFVQGVSIDPFGRLIASLGNDRALRIFTSSASNSWYQVASVSSHMDNDSRLFIDDAKFKNCFRRLAWSPDGSVVACPSGMHLPHTNRLFAVHLFARNSWYRPAAQCGGLVKPACAVRFSPVLYELRHVPEKRDGVDVAPGEGGVGPFASFKYRMIFAVLCVDSVLFYDTQALTRPFAMVEGLHCAENTDISWSSDGLTAAISSVDGYVSFVCFTKEELGEPLALKNTPPWLNQQAELDQSLMGRSPRNSQAKVAVTVVRPKSACDTTVASSRPPVQFPPPPIAKVDNAKVSPNLPPPGPTPVALGGFAKTVVSQPSSDVQPTNVTKTANGGQRISVSRPDNEECLNSHAQSGHTEKGSETAEIAMREAMSEILMSENSQSPIPASRKSKEPRSRTPPQDLVSKLEHESAGKAMPAIEATPGKILNQEKTQPIGSDTDQAVSDGKQEPRSPMITSRSPGKTVSVDPASPLKSNTVVLPKLPKPAPLTPNLTARLSQLARETSDPLQAVPKTVIPKSRPKSGKVVQTTLFSFTGGNSEKPKRRPTAPENRKISSDVSIQGDESTIPKRKLMTLMHQPQEEDEMQIVEAPDSVPQDACFGEAKRRKLTEDAGTNSF